MHNTSERAAAIIEFALVLPFVLIVGFFSLEYARVFKTYEAMSAISREAARIPLLECEHDPDFVGCLASKNVYSKIAAVANGLLPGAEIVISAYDLGTGGAAPTIVFSGQQGLVARQVAGVTVYQTPTLAKGSQFNAARILSLIGRNSSLLYDFAPNGPSKKRMVVGEVFYSLRSIAPRSFRFFPLSKVIYEPTMF